jgi:uncharacterized protein (TIGR00255 family)
MRSMTGQGRGECTRDGVRVVVELRAVNRRQTEIMVQLPELLVPLETRVRDLVGTMVSRGRCEVRVQLELPGGLAPARVNVAVAKAYAGELARLAMELGRPEVPSLEVLIRCPGVLEAGSGGSDAEVHWGTLEEALRAGLGSMDQMRRREGEALASDLADRIRLLREAAERVRERAPQVMVRYRENLTQRLRAAGLEGIPVEDERILKELVVYADRSDISEELARLDSHFQQFEDCRRSKEAVGRTLDFLAQEMNREINTIGSKANDAVISAEVVRLKTELERFREQAQNVE